MNIKQWWEKQRANPIKKYFWYAVIFVLIFAMGYCSASNCGNSNQVETIVVEQV